MKKTKKIVFLFAAALLGGFLATQARADALTRKTLLTFHRPVQVSGHMLAAGTYTFKWVDATTFRNIVQIRNAEDTRTIATILAISAERMNATDNTVISFYETPADEPPAIRSWFAPSELIGYEFVYPKKQAVELAQATKQIVPAEAFEPTESTMKSVPLVAEAPESNEQPITQLMRVPPAATEPEVVTVAQAELPKTASPIPLIALMGATFIAIGFGLKRLAATIS